MLCSFALESLFELPSNNAKCCKAATRPKAGGSTISVGISGSLLRSDFQLSNTLTG